jgi:serine/threonine-protein kinase ULK/ATG1
MTSKKRIGDYILEENIGQGQFGKIFKSRKINTKTEVAIKVIKKAVYQSNKQLLIQLRREIKIMNQLAHPNLMKLHEFFQSSKNYYIVMDLCPEGDMLNFMSQYKIKFFYEKEAILLMSHIRNGFSQLRKMHILHRDLKLANIFVKKGHLVIGDFGTSKIFNGMTNTTVGTPINMAPEILKGLPYNHKSDIWSLGVIFYHLLFGSVPFYGFSIGDLLNQIAKNSGQNLKFSNKILICSSVKKFLMKMLEQDPNKRMSWEEFRYHFIFTDEHILNCSNFNSCQRDLILKKFKFIDIPSKILIFF